VQEVPHNRTYALGIGPDDERLRDIGVQRHLVLRRVLAQLVDDRRHRLGERDPFRRRARLGGRQPRRVEDVRDHALQAAEVGEQSLH
jgi:hypothetical protein